MHAVMADAFAAFKAEVEAKTFPGEEHSVAMKEEQWQALMSELDGKA
jgi:ketopantoate hydroxymethyltransferase